MSMLAERKYKQKWCLNPRGNLWAEDKNKFGKRIMEKMGWKDGKGLGANEDGSTAHVKVSYKNDSKGMGFKENGEQWTEHEDKFTTLLKSLDPNNTASDEKPVISGASLEEKSQKSRSRVHYHKFTRGKDLTRYSEKDLANIFGKKSLKPTPQKSEPIEEEQEEQPEVEGEEKTGGNKFGVETVERGSMVDYFKQKISHFSMRGSYDVGANGVLKSAAKPESDSETEEKCGFGFAQPEKPSKASKTSFVSYVKATNTAEIYNSEIPVDGEKKKKKKRKNAEATEDGPASSKKMKFEQSEEDSGPGFVNPAFDPLSRSKIVGIKHSLTTIAEENVEENGEEEEDNSRAQTTPKTGPVEETPKLKKKKNKKQKLVETIERREEENDSCFTNATIETSVALEDELDASIVSNPYEVKRKTKKKKQKTNPQEDSSSYCNPAMEENELDSSVSENVNVTCSNSETYEVKRKTKKCKKKSKDVDEDLETEQTKKNMDEGVDNPDVLENTNDSVSDKKSKKKKLKISKSEESGLDNPALNLSTEQNSSDNPATQETTTTQEASIQKRKKTDLNASSEETSQAESNKKSKKRKKNKNGLDNPGLSLNLSQEPTSDADLTKENLSVDFATPKTGTASTSAESSVKRKKSVRFSETNDEHVIPNVLHPETNGLDNAGFDLANNVVSEGVDNLNNALDKFQTELENDLNEKKQKFQELQRLQRENLPKVEDQSKFRQPKVRTDFTIEDPCEEDAERGVILKYAESNMRKFTMRYKSDNTTAKRTYRHLIKGDILVEFKGTNFHTIEGYARKREEK